MAEHQPSCKQSCTQSDSLWRTEYTTSTKAFGSNTVTVFKFIPLETTHISVLCIPIIGFLWKLFPEQTHQLTGRSSLSNFPTFLKALMANPGSQLLCPFRPIARDQRDCYRRGPLYFFLLISDLTYLFLLFLPLCCVMRSHNTEKISQKTNLLGKTCSLSSLRNAEVRAEQSTWRPSPALPAKVMKRCWQGQRTLNPP